MQLTIDGVNLGNSYQDVAKAVTAANVHCIVNASLYVTATRIVCRTGSVPNGKMAHGPVIIKLKEELGYTAITDSDFKYVVPLVTKIEPNRGE